MGLVERLQSVCGQVSTDPADLAATARDRWTMAASVVARRAEAVASPASAAEVAAVLALCSEAGVPVTPAGARSGVCGGAMPVHGGVVLDLRGLAGVRSVDGASLLVDAGAGTMGDALEAELRSAHGLTLGHRPQSVAISTVGGWLACRSAGQYSTRYGKIEDMVVGLDVALADGRLIHTGGAPRAATGPDLTQLFVGSEGTLGVITSARLRVHPAPPADMRAAYAFPSFGAGLDACRRILRRGATPAVLRLYDAAESARSFDREDCVLIVLDEGDRRLVEATMSAVAGEAATVAVVAEEASTVRAVAGAGEAATVPVAGAGEAATLAGIAGDRGAPIGPEAVDRWMAHRDETPDTDELARQGIFGDTMEVAAGWSALPALYESVIAAVGAVPGTVWVSGHLSHAYGGGACLYVTFAGAGAAWYVPAWDAAAGAVLAAGGTLSHHHGIGLAKARFLPAALGGAHQVLADIKAVLDPAGILNPGKLGLPDPFGGPAWP